MLVPPVHMKSLYDLAIRSRMKDFYSVAGGTHNDTWEVAGAQYYRRLKAFIDAALLDDRKDNTCSSNAEDDSTPESELKRINSDVVLP